MKIEFFTKLGLIISTTVILICFCQLIGCSMSTKTVTAKLPDNALSSDKMTLGVLYFDNNLLDKDHDSLDRLRTGIPHSLMNELSKIDNLIILDRMKLEFNGDTKPMGAKILCSGAFTSMPGVGDEIVLQSSVSDVQNGKVLVRHSVKGTKQEFSKLIKSLASEMAEKLGESRIVMVKKEDIGKIKKEDTIYSALSLVTFEEAQELESSGLIDDSKSKYKEAIKISPKYREAKMALDRLSN